MVFGGFRRCLYPYQKFDSDSERLLALVLEDDTACEKWCKPKKGVFRIDYASGRAYEPDFIAETAAVKLMIEVKRANQLGDVDVLAKAEAAQIWCGHASEHEAANGGKPWRYLLIPHDGVSAAASVAGLVGKYAQGAAGKP